MATHEQYAALERVKADGPTPLDTALDRLSTAVDDLVERVALLTDRLTPVLTEPGALAQPLAVPEGASPLASQVLRITARVDDAVFRVVWAKDHLDLDLNSPQVPR